MNDIETKADVQLLINNFYSKLMNDDYIGHFFTSDHFTLESHLPVMVSFWENILFGVNSYHGNPIIKHIELNEIMPFRKDHFSYWLKVWEETIYETFKGKKADEALERAKSIARIMEFKVIGS